MKESFSMISQEIHTNRNMSNESLESFWVQNPKIQKEAHSFLTLYILKNVA